MAMNAATLAADLKADYLAEFQALYSNIPDDHTLSGYDMASFQEKYFLILANRFVNHIQTNARCNGLDSHSDSHENVGIV